MKISRKRREIVCGAPRLWLSVSEVETLVIKSSGLFIYASTLLNFVDTKDKHIRNNSRLY
jgi:hypothetical protein